MAKERPKKSRRTVKSLAVPKLTTAHASGVRGGIHKHIAGVKYNDVTVNSTTQTPK